MSKIKRSHKSKYHLPELTELTPEQFYGEIVESEEFIKECRWIARDIGVSFHIVCAVLEHAKFRGELKAAEKLFATKDRMFDD